MAPQYLRPAGRRGAWPLFRTARGS